MSVNPDVECPVCHGTGKDDEKECLICGGVGRLSEIIPPRGLPAEEVTTREDMRRDTMTPERVPNAGDAIRVLGTGMYLDTPAFRHGVQIRAKIDLDGWLRVTVEADDSVKGWVLWFNGRDIPITVDAAGGPAVSEAEA